MRDTHFIPERNNAQFALRNAHLVQRIGRMKTGDVIRKLRKEKKLTLAEVESRAGLSDGNLSRIERGEQWLSEEKLYAVADALGVTPAEFFHTSTKIGSATTALSPVDLIKGTPIVELEELLQIITGYWDSTVDGRKQIRRAVQLAEKTEKSSRASTSGNKG